MGRGREGERSVYSPVDPAFCNSNPCAAKLHCLDCGERQERFVAIYSFRRFDVAIGSRLIARRLRFAVNRLAVHVRACVCASALRAPTSDRVTHRGNSQTRN